MAATKVTLYTTSTCPESERAARMLDALGIPYVKKAIDLDPEAQTDALMLKIVRVPASMMFPRALVARNRATAGKKVTWMRAQHAHPGRVGERGMLDASQA